MTASTALRPWGWRPIRWTARSRRKKLLRQLAERDYAVIYMTEALAQQLAAEVSRYRTAMTPAIILIPGVAGNTEQGIRSVKQSVEKAVGSDILFSNQ